MVHEACESIAIAADAPSIMAIIADFPAYPQWAGYIKQADVLRTGPTGRAERVHFVLDAGVMRDDYVLNTTGAATTGCTGRWSKAGR